MINSGLIRELRQQQSWSQNQLATVSGLSLRTVQRVEKTGVCSLETSRALASVFEVDVALLHTDTIPERGDLGLRRVRFWGVFGNPVGLICAYLAITYSVITESLKGMEADYGMEVSVRYCRY